MIRPVDRAEIKRYLPWVVAVSFFMLQLDATILNTVVPVMAKGFGVPSLSLKSVLTSYTITLAVFIPMSGWVADRFGTCRVFLAAMGVFTAGSLLCGVSTTVPMLVASRVVQGLGAAFMTPIGRTAILRTFEKSEILRTMNFVIIPALLGPLLGPFFGGVIVHYLPWRMIFFLNIPVGVAGMYLARRYMPDHRAPEKRSLDVTGFLLFSSGVALLSYVLEVFGEHRLSGIVLGSLFALSLLLLAGYGAHAANRRDALLDLFLVKIRTFRVSVVGGCITRLGMSGMPFLLPLLYQVGLGYAPWQAGLLTMPQALAAIGMKMMVRPILRRFGFRQVLLLNTILIGVTILMFSTVGPSTPLAFIIGLSLLQGFFSALQFTSMNSLAYADTTDAQASGASTIASTVQQLSISFGIACASLVAGFFMSMQPESGSTGVVHALHLAFLVLGGWTIISGVTFLSLAAEDGEAVSRGTDQEGVEAHSERRVRAAEEAGEP
jgi:EmrB/QacA subfamily drug resistance transporter